jgi:hypothetical protein
MTSPFPFSSGDVLTAANLNAIGEKTAFTPSWINLTPGNATETWFYTQVNDLVYVTGQTVFGSTTSISGTFRIEYPIGTSSNLGEPKGWAFYLDDDTSTTYAGFIHPAFAGNVYFGTLDPSGSTYLTLGLNSNQNRPFTWAVDDKIRASFVYQIAV